MEVKALHGAERAGRRWEVSAGLKKAEGPTKLCNVRGLEPAAATAKPVAAEPEEVVMATPYRLGDPLRPLHPYCNW